jgi:polyvinyl alcohol dehydrogenase (cytochrome)
MIADAPTPRAKNAKGTQLWGPSGAAVWSAPTVDAVTKSLYVATGDAYSMPAAPTTDAIVALDLETGAIKWVSQTTAGDAFTMACGTADTTNCPEKAGPDHDFGQSPILVTLGNGKRVIVAGQKSGVVHGFDPDQRGKKLWSTTVGRGGELGGIEWGSASDGTNMYVPLSDITFKEPALRQRGGLNAEVGGGLFALRLTDGKQAWLSRPNACGDKRRAARPSPRRPRRSRAPCSGIDRRALPGLCHDRWARALGFRYRPRLRHGQRREGARRLDRRRRRRNRERRVVVTTSGYGQWGGMRGNVLLVFSIDGR